MFVSIATQKFSGGCLKCHRLAGKAVLNVGMFYSLVSSLFIVDVEKPQQMEVEEGGKGID